MFQFFVNNDGGPLCCTPGRLDGLRGRDRLSLPWIRFVQISILNPSAGERKYLAASAVILAEA